MALIFLVVLVLLVLSGPVVAAAVLFLQKRRSRASKRSPLTADLLRPPGHSLQIQIELLRDKIDENLIFLVAAPLVMFSVHVSYSYFFSVSESIFRTTLSLLAVSVAIGWTSSRLVKFSKQLDRLRIGIDAEMFVGQELGQLMRGGALVFHDVPANKFNIDHLVIARTGVFAVETKGRAKPIRGKGSQDASITFDGNTLHFPSWSEVAPLAQAKRQADWVAVWLTSAVGEKVDVTPVLAVPGWFIERRAPSPVLLFNGKNPEFLLKLRSPILSDEMMKRISHQVEQRCRNVEPKYGTQKGHVREAWIQ